MSKTAFDPSVFPQAVGEHVACLERISDAEVVVVVRRSSGSYADIDLGWAILAALAALLLMVHGPWVFHANGLVLNSLFAGALLWLLSRRFPGMRRLLAPAARRRQQVEAAARSAFMEEGVGSTRTRTGILVFLSLLERECLILPDVGVDGRVPRAVWTPFRERLERAADLASLEQAVLQTLQGLCAPLGQHLPATDQHDELPNAARMQL